MKNTAVCTAVNNASKNCTDYPASIGNKIQKIIEKVKAKISKAGKLYISNSQPVNLSHVKKMKIFS